MRSTLRQSNSTDYHRIVIELMKPFVEADGPVPQEVHDRAQSITQQSQHQLRVLVHQIDLQYPDLPIALNILLKPLISVANETLPRIHRTGETCDEAFYFNLCIKIMRRMAGPYPLLRFVVLGIKQVANRQGLTLPQEAQETIKALEGHRRGSMPSGSTDSLPATSGLSAEDLEASNLRNLIGETDKLNLDRRGSSGAQ